MRRYSLALILLMLPSDAMAVSPQGVAVRNSTGDVVADVQATAPANTATGLVVRPANASVSTATGDGACPSGSVSFTVLAANTARKAAYLWASPANGDDVYLKLGATATTSDARLAPGQPFNLDAVIYTGVIDAFPASGTQAVCVVEL